MKSIALRNSLFPATALSLVALLSVARAQGADTPSIVLPPLPDIAIDIDRGAVTRHIRGAMPVADPAPAGDVTATRFPPESDPLPIGSIDARTDPAPLRAEAPMPTEQPAPDLAQPKADIARPAQPQPPALPPIDQAQAPTTDTAAALQSALTDTVAPALRKDREAIAAFYAARAYAPLWINGAEWNGAARAALARLARAADDALDLRATPVPSRPDAANPAVAELALSHAIVLYGRQASGARVDPRSIARLITEKPEVADAATILASVSTAPDANAALAAFNPAHAGYVALRDKLAETRRESGTPMARISAGPTLKVGMSDARVPLIRARLGLSADSAPLTTDEMLYDTRTASAVADFQRTHGLPPSGQITPRTVAVLSGGEPARLEAEIIANMERWRWMPRKVSADVIEVNIPDYSVKVTRGGEVVHRARVIVGKPDTPTPVFSNRMQFIEVNPYWNVPDSIIKKEMMPKLAADPDYLNRLGYEVRTVNGRMVVRQPPGERNALGRIKFMFPNEHAVYLHDTPTRGLFANDKRAYSHGCVRVDKPEKFGEIVMGPDSGWTEARIQKLVGGANRTIKLPQPLDIHIEYFTAFVDEAGHLQLRDDVYGYSHKLKVALGLEG